jgi:MSHA type pilus biogenesis protein MshL
MNLKLENPVEFWKELQEQLGKIVTPSGKERLAIDQTSGIIQVTDRPSAIKKVASFLDELGRSILRQVDIEAKIYELSLSEQFHLGIDWDSIIRSHLGNLAAVATPTVVSPFGGDAKKPESIMLHFTKGDTSVILTALQEQGRLNVVSQPRLRTLNNQTAIIKVGQDRPFFSQQSQFVTGVNTVSQSGDILSVITIGTVLAITPQVATNGWITLDVSPAITGFVEEVVSKSGQSTAPALDIKQASTLVRVRNGETIVMGGLIQDKTSKTTRKIPLIADIPWLGKLFQGKFESKSKTELVIFLTPHIVE